MLIKLLIFIECILNNKRLMRKKRYIHFTSIYKG